MRPKHFAGFLFSLLLTAPAIAQIPGEGITLLGTNNQLYGSTGDTLYTYTFEAGTKTTVLNSSANDLVLCLERPDGTLLGINAANSTSQLVSVTLSGTITAIAPFPANTTAVCPAMANDGNYYGAGYPGGTYGAGYLYQLTSSGALNLFYYFTGKGDGTGALSTPVQASNGDLYFTGSNSLVQYSASTGVAVYPTGNFSGPPVEGADGAFYYTSGQSIYRVETSGADTPLYTNTDDYGFSGLAYVSSQSVSAVETFFQSDNHECAPGYYFAQITPVSYSGGGAPGEPGYFGGEVDSLTLNLFLSGNGYYYGSAVDITDCGSGECGCDFTTSYAVVAPANEGADTASITPVPIQMNLSQTHVKVNGTATVTWDITNAFSLTAQQCYGYGGLSGKLALSGSATVKAMQSGVNNIAIVCGGTEENSVQLTAGAPSIILTSSQSVLPVGGSDTLTARLSNSGTPSPTGSVSFYAGTVLLGTVALSGNSASLTAAANNIRTGAYSITATYSGDANYNAITSSPVSVAVVAKTSTSTSLTPTTQTLLDGDTVTLTATVTCTSPYECPATVDLLYHKNIVASVALTYSAKVGTATFSLSSDGIPAGTYQLQASCPRDSWNLASTSSAVTVVLQPSATVVKLAISPNPVAASASFTLTATATGKGTPTGTVIFYAGSTQLASTSLNGSGIGQVTLPAGTLAAGTYSMTAYYAGDSNNPSATSTPVSLTVQ